MSEPVQLGRILPTVLSDIAKRIEKARSSMLDSSSLLDEIKPQTALLSNSQAAFEAKGIEQMPEVSG